jgi:mono/diheme cytochrome c family protein
MNIFFLPLQISKEFFMRNSSPATVIIFFSFFFFLLIACKEGVQKDKEPVDIQQLANDKSETHGPEIKESEIQITNPLNQEWVTAGKNIYEVKCQACHKLTEERLVGPGWKYVTKRREPVWIMNMITNVDMMLETDPEAQKLLELCLVRMPNQNIKTEDARKVLEFMRNNDGEK